MADLNELFFGEENPYISQGMKRRSAAAAEPPPTTIETIDPYEGNWLAETTRSQLQRVANYAPALEGLARRSIGDEAGADDAFSRYLEGEERARALGPRVQTFDDAEDAGGDFGDYASAVGYQAAQFVPDLALSLTGAGLGAVGARGIARRAVASTVERELGERATTSAVRSEARREAGRAAKAASELRTPRDGADALLNQRLRDQASRLVNEGRVGADTVDAATKLGRVAGAAAGQYPGLTADSVEQLQQADDAGVAKIAAANLGAAAIGAIPVERFFGRFGDDAVQQVRRSADGFFKRVAKEYAKQGVTEAGTEVAQTAVQLAGQKWANDNIDLLGPEAMDQYIASAIGGFVAGGTLGGASEAGRATGDAVRAGIRRIGAGADALRTRVRGALGAAGERARKAWGDSPTPGAEIGPGGPDTPSPDTSGGGAASRFQDALKTVQGWGESAAQAARRWRGNLDQTQYEQELDADAGQVLDLAARYDAGEAPLTPVRQRPVDNPVQLPNRWQNALVASISHDSPIWETPDLVKRIGGTLEHVLFGKDLSQAQARLLSDLTSGESPVLDPARVKLWEAAAPEMAAREAALKHFGDMRDTDATPNDALREELASREGGEGRVTPAAVDSAETTAAESRGNADSINVRGRDAIATALPAERITNAREAIRAINGRIKATTDADAIASLKAERAATQSEGLRAQAELRAQILGEVRERNPFGANVFVKNQSSPEAAVQFDQRAKEPGRVVLADQVNVGKTKPLLRDAALGVDTLVAQRLSQLSDNFTADDAGQRDLRRAATLQAFADLRLAGIRIRPESITPGRMYVGKGSERRLVGELTPRMVAQLRGQFLPAKGENVQPQRAAKWTEETGPLSPKERAFGEGDFDEGSDTRLVPREAPEGRRAPDGSFVPTQDVVTDVSLSPSPYEPNVATARAARRGGPPPSQTRAAIHTEGVKIGEAELARQRNEGQISERRYNTELKRLSDYESGLSRRYLNDAATGAFDSARITEARVAKDVIDKAAQRQEAADNAKRERKAKGTQRDDLGADLATIVKGEEHDTGLETAMLNRVLGRLGLDSRIKVMPLGARKAGTLAGDYTRQSYTIRISDRLTGPERAEVLFHELGHHIAWDQVAKAMHVPFKDAARLSERGAVRAFRKGNPELYTALRQDYATWVRQFRGTDPTLLDVRVSRAPWHRAFNLMTRTAASPRLSEASAAERRYQFSVHEWAADHIARALASKPETFDAMTAVDRFFKAIVDALRAAYDSIFGDPNLKEFAPAKSVDAWIQSLFDTNVRAASQGLGHTVTQQQANTTVQAAVANAAPQMGGGGTPPPGAAPPPGGGPWSPGGPQIMAFVRDVMRPQERQILDRVFNRGAAVRRLREIYQNAPAALELLDDAKQGLEGRIALGYLAWQNGLFNVGPQGRTVLNDVSDDLAAVFNLAADGAYAQRILSDMASGVIQRFHNANRTYDVQALEARARGTRQQVLDRIGSYRQKVAVPYSRFIDSKLKRMWSAGVPAARELAALLQRPQGTTGDDRGMLPAIVHTTALYAQRATKAMEGLSEREAIRAMDMMQRQIAPGDANWRGNAKVAAAVTELRGLFGDAYDYMKGAGVDVGMRARFFPVVFDLRNDAVKDKLTRLYSQQKFEAPIRDFFQDQKTPVDRLVKNLVEGATRLDGLAPTTGSGAPNFKSANYRLSQFVYDHGDAADIKTFASVQSKNPAEVFARYIEPMVKRAEYARRFGDDGAKLEKLLERMRKQGASDADIELSQNAVEAALGTFGADGSPVLRMLSPALADRFKGPKTQSAIQGIQAYQNARLLPLSTLSSLVDPMGIAVRAGGDFATAWDGWKTGIKTLANKQTKAELHQMLAQLGATEDMSTLEGLNAGFGGAGNPTAQAINNFIFKWNGLSAWTRATRYMALISAHGFLLKHAAGSNDTSRRYLAELGLDPGDVRPDPNDPRRVELNDKTRSALLQFVDEAILRPNSQQTPLWHSDPYMGLVTQYKAFAYAIYDQIGGRISREFQHGNLRVLLPAMSYVPVVIATELLRELIQHGAEGNAQRRSWGPDDYLKLGVEKSGLLGPQYALPLDLRQDVQRGYTPGNSQIGPAASQVKNALSRQDLGKTFEDALPGSAAFKRWNDFHTTGAQARG